MVIDKSKNTDDSDSRVSSQAQNKRTDEEPNEETTIYTKGNENQGASYGTLSEVTTTYAPIKPGEQVSKRRPLQRWGSAIEEEDNEDLQIDIPVAERPEKNGPVSWSSLPHRKQLIILTCVRLSEPLVGTSLRVSTKIYYQCQVIQILE